VNIGPERRGVDQTRITVLGIAGARTEFLGAKTKFLRIVQVAQLRVVHHFIARVA
jgi:hypothetical protein